MDAGRHVSDGLNRVDVQKDYLLVKQGAGETMDRLHPPSNVFVPGKCLFELRETAKYGQSREKTWTVVKRSRIRDRCISDFHDAAEMRIEGRKHDEGAWMRVPADVFPNVCRVSLRVRTQTEGNDDDVDRATREKMVLDVGNCAELRLISPTNHGGGDHLAGGSSLSGSTWLAVGLNKDGE
jgi:hypothetical protein